MVPGALLSKNSYSPLRSRFMMPHSSSVTEPPQVTSCPSSRYSATCSMASLRVGAYMAFIPFFFRASTVFAIRISTIFFLLSFILTAPPESVFFFNAKRSAVLPALLSSSISVPAHLAGSRPYPHSIFGTYRPPHKPLPIFAERNHPDTDTGWDL